jgi:hypothetical protein
MATAAKFVLPIPIFLAYLVPLDVDMTGNITEILLKVALSTIKQTFVALMSIRVRH